jgi:hypothetical protein
VSPPNGGTTGTGINAACTTPAEKTASQTNDSPKKRACPPFSSLPGLSTLLVDICLDYLRLISMHGS